MREDADPRAVAVAEALRLVGLAAEGADIRPIGVACGRAFVRGDRQAAAVVALGALMALPDAVFERLVAEEGDRRGLTLARLGVHEATLLEGALAALSLLDRLPGDLRRDVLRRALEADEAPVAPPEARRRMASLWLDLPLADRRAFMDWAREEMAA